MKGQELELGAEEKREAEDKLFLPSGFYAAGVALCLLPGSRTAHITQPFLCRAQAFKYISFMKPPSCATLATYGLQGLTVNPDPGPCSANFARTSALCELPVHLKIISIGSTSWKFVLSIVFDKLLDLEIVSPSPKFRV